MDKYEFYIPSSFHIIFGKSIKDFYYDSKLYKNRSFVFTFFNSILLIENKFFHLNTDTEKEKIVKQLIKKMSDELFEKDLYKKFDFSKNRKINKTNLQSVLQDSIHFKNNDYFTMLLIYLSHYLGINIYIFKVVNHHIDFLNSVYYVANHSLYNPHFILFFENEIYKPVMMNSNNRSILTYDKNKIIIDNIWSYLNIVNNEKKDGMESIENEKKCNKVEEKEEIIQKEDTIFLEQVNNSAMLHNSTSVNNSAMLHNSTSVNNSAMLHNLITHSADSPCFVVEERIEDYFIESPTFESKVNNKELVKEESKEQNNTKKKYSMKEVKNMKIDELRKICEEEKIDIKKKSDKTSKMIFKLKDELIEDILEIKI
jgi:hypothetical protein